MAGETRICDSCDAEIGKTEEKCPKCQADQAENDELASAIERGSSILEKRKKRATPPPPPPAPAAAPKKGLSRLREIGRGFRKEK